jgi:hypothetical protein
MNLNRFTRRLEECRKRWNHDTVRYVVGVARIVRAARRAAKDERRWGEWIRKETHMNRSTVYRYMRVAEFLKANVSLKQQLASLSIAKLYALSRLKPEQAMELVRSGKAAGMNDVSFMELASRLQPSPVARAILPNLFRSLDAALSRLDWAMKRWQQSQLVMPAPLQSKLQTRLHAMSRVIDRLRKGSAVAM